MTDIPFLDGEDFWFKAVRERTIQERRNTIKRNFDVVHHILSFNDLALSYYSDQPKIRGQVSILYLIQDLIVREWTGYAMSLIYGAYENCARSLRWVLETTISGGGAVVDAKLLNHTFHEGPASLGTFVKWLRLRDEGEPGPSRPIILSTLGFSQREVEDAQQTYAHLCKFCHPSQRSVVMRRKSEYWDWLTKFDPREFDRVTRISYKCIDLLISIILRSYRHITSKVSSAIEQEFIEVCESYRYHEFGFNMPLSMRDQMGKLELRKVPITRNLLLDWRTSSRSPSALQYHRYR